MFTADVSGKDAGMQSVKGDCDRLRVKGDKNLKQTIVSDRWNVGHLQKNFPALYAQDLHWENCDLEVGAAQVQDSIIEKRGMKNAAEHVPVLRQQRSASFRLKFRFAVLRRLEHDAE